MAPSTQEGAVQYPTKTLKSFGAIWLGREAPLHNMGLPVLLMVSEERNQMQETWLGQNFQKRSFPA